LEKNNIFSFKLGNFDCLVIRDATTPLTLKDIFSKNLEKHPHLVTPYNEELAKKGVTMCLFIRTKEHFVLVDTGWGAESLEYPGSLIKTMQNTGIKTGEIDLVIHTHGHIDHVGGNTDSKLKPNFPNALHIMYQGEWDFWMAQLSSPHKENIHQHMRDAAEKNLVSIKSRYKLIKNNEIICPGIKVITTPGHTPGHTAVVVSSNKKQLLVTGDLFQHLLQIENPDISGSFDAMPEEAANSRIQVLKLAISTNALVFTSHLPYPGLGYITQQNGSYQWNSIQ
jgi:glyoxylase-like metal-dependent hydrolase (beta-lactamase superfamily II)